MKRKYSVVIVLLFLTTMSLPAQEQLPYLGIDHFVVAELPPVRGELQATCGLMVSFPRCNAPAFWAGVRNRDIIIGFEGIPFTASPENIFLDFRSKIAQKRVGDIVRLQILRMQPDASLQVDGKSINSTEMIATPARFLNELPDDCPLEFTMTKQWIPLTIPVKLGLRLKLDHPPTPDFFDTAIGKWVSANQTPEYTSWSDIAEAAVDRYGFRNEYTDLRKQLQSINTTSDGTRLSAISTIHRFPEKAERIARSLTGLIAAGNEGVLAAGGYITERPILPPAAATPPLSSDCSEAEFRAWFDAALVPVRSRLDQAYSSLSKQEMDFLLAHRFELTDYFVDSTYIHADFDPARFEHNLKNLEIARKLNLQALIESAALLESFIRSASPNVFTWMKSHPQTRKMTTSEGLIGFGTAGRDLWTDPAFAFIYDPAGNDYYGDGTATADSFDRLISWVIDRRGNDVYRSQRRGAQAFASPGLAFLLDMSGDDSYLAKRWAQGAGYMGVGMLIDNNGSDEYSGTEYLQGSGLFGLGALVDHNGNDRYFANMYAQGIGMTRGLGVLYDKAGNDRGLCTGMQSSGFGDSGLFNGWGQGCGVGFRGLTSGGIGVVLDTGGSDRWEGGAFSLGSGYYYGMGLFHSMGTGDDLYYGTRYTIGNTAHQGTGIFFDDGGNDIYTTGQCETTGIAWDESVALFVEGGGDDCYYGGTGFDLGWIEHKWQGFALGAAAQNGFTVFIDKSGKDHYDYPPGPGRADDNSYHGGFSFALFLDQGLEVDFYNSPHAADNTERAWAQFGIFMDGSAEPLRPLRLIRDMKPYPYRRGLNKN